MHLIATNVIVWTRTLAQEILDEFLYVDGYFRGLENATDTEISDPADAPGKESTKHI